ncbi:hypothetical protein PFMALIP_05957, partial [Plasmodium falciparum MaliPS096_E11]
MSTRGPQVGGDADKYDDAKNMFDRIGQQVHEKVKTEALKRSNGELKGNLARSSILGERAFTENPCIFEYHKLINGSGGSVAAGTVPRDDPCKKDTNGNDVDRFSDKEGAECANSKIHGNSKGKNGTDVGACAPFRRLSLCNKNFQNINSKDSSKAKNDLLLDVCMAANYEAQSLITYHDKHELTNVGSQICTVLARSFADIGDIVRGRDLYLGNKKKNKTETEREKLEKKLKDIFKEIHENLEDTTIKSKYNGDTTDYYLLREDWWEENRQQVWKAMTCSDRLGGNAYFRATCNDTGRGGAQANHYCRCNDDKPHDDKTNTDPPTYFDYVPQFLRWFEEWAEDFCRKKKIYVGIVKKYCRKKDNSSEERYCSRNGFDCEKTKRAIGKYRMGKQCISCLYACNPYVDWINNQKEQFDKQKNKYTDEINGTSRSSRRQKRGTNITNYEGYDRKFYNILKNDGNYSDVNAFLGLLSKEKTCKDIKDDKEGGTINFKTVNSGSASGGGDSGTNNASQGTFYRSDYCQPCPLCGVKKTNNGGSGSGWEKKNDKCNIKLYKPRSGEQGTPINFLYSGEGETEIKEKLEQFCDQINRGTTNNGGNGTGSGNASSIGSGDCGGNSDSSLCEKWECYQSHQLEKVGGGEDDEDDEDDPEYEKDVQNAGGLCILEKKNDKGVQKQKTFHDFFYYWVAHMLKDSIHWKKKLERCLQNGNRIKCGNQKCKGNCKCFLQWVGQKEKEWGQIKVHFNTQEGLDSEGGISSHPSFNLGMTADVVLEGVLEKDELLSSIKEGYGDANEIKHIKELLEEDETKSKAEAADGGTDNKNKTTIDKLLKHEGDEATKCKNCQETQPQQPVGPPGRADTGTSSPAAPTLDDNNEEEDEEEEEEDDEDDTEESPQAEAVEPEAEKAESGSEEGAGEGDQETKVNAPEDGKGPSQEDPKVCETVDNILTKDTTALNEACKQKYQYGKEKFPNWKCVTPSGDKAATSGSVTTTRGEPTSVPTTGSSGKTTPPSNSGSICVPPRRRRLYVGKLHDWAKEQLPQGENGGKVLGSDQAAGGKEGPGAARTQLQDVDGKTPSQPDPKVELRNAFIESAAIETFFLWHKYKAENTKTQSESQLQLLEDAILSSDEKTPETSLKSGKIPTEFLRQMFYTLGDYRDILFSGVKGEKSGVKDIFSGDKEIAQREKEIKDAIQKFFEEYGKNQPNNGTPVQTRGNQSPSDDKTPQQTWWKTNGEHIWKGMVCALTYDTNTTSGTPLKQIEGAQNLLDKLKKEKGTEGKYHYEKVTLENSETEAKPTGSQTTQSSASSGDSTLNNPKLSDFVLRPPYFRYLEEWGETFCRERSKRLAQIKVDCEVETDGPRRGKQKIQKYSGDGEQCDRTNISNKGLFADLEKPSCATSCRSYKKWIERKKDEYEKQQKAYNEQKEKYEKESESDKRNKDDNAFRETLQKYTEAKHFLQKLGSCKKDNGNSNIPFDDGHETFEHAKNCAPCSEFRVNCIGDNYSKDIKDTCINKKITAEDIDKKTETINVDMVVSDNTVQNFADGLQEACGSANIFKGIRKEQWKCLNVCGYVVCKPKEGNGAINAKHIVQIRALVKRWLENFLEDYNKIRKKLKPCIENGNASTCINGCNKKCKCVGEWIKLKKEEWQEIKNLEQKQNESKDDDNTLTNFLETFTTEIAAANDKKKSYDELDELKKSLGCNCADSSQKKDTDKRDIIQCLLEKLGEKATSCLSSTSGEKTNTCGEKSPAHVEDDEEDLLLEEENEKTL